MTTVTCSTVPADRLAGKDWLYISRPDGSTYFALRHGDVVLDFATIATLFATFGEMLTAV